MRCSRAGTKLLKFARAAIFRLDTRDFCILWPRARSGVDQLKFKNNTGIRIRACTRTAASRARGGALPSGLALL
jgi:hypothetical protein